MVLDFTGKNFHAINNKYAAPMGFAVIGQKSYQRNNVLVCQLDTNRNGLGGVLVEECLDQAGLWA